MRLVHVTAGQQSGGYLLSATLFVRPVLGCLPVLLWQRDNDVGGPSCLWERTYPSDLLFVFVCVYLLSTRSQETQAGFELSMSMRLTLNSCSSYLPVQGTRIIGLSQHTWLIFFFIFSCVKAFTFLCAWITLIHCLCCFWTLSYYILLFAQWFDEKCLTIGSDIRTLTPSFGEAAWGGLGSAALLEEVHRQGPGFESLNLSSLPVCFLWFVFVSEGVISQLPFPGSSVCSHPSSPWWTRIPLELETKISSLFHKLPLCGLK